VKRSDEIEEGRERLPPPHATRIAPVPSKKWSFLSVIVAVAVAAWLLNRQQTPVQTPVQTPMQTHMQTPEKKKKRNADMAGSYSIADSRGDRGGRCGE